MNVIFNFVYALICLYLNNLKSININYVCAIEQKYRNSHLTLKKDWNLIVTCISRSPDVRCRVCAGKCTVAIDFFLAYTCTYTARQNRTTIFRSCSYHLLRPKLTLTIPASLRLEWRRGEGGGGGKIPLGSVTLHALSPSLAANVYHSGFLGGLRKSVNGSSS